MRKVACQGVFEWYEDEKGRKYRFRRDGKFLPQDSAGFIEAEKIIAATAHKSVRNSALSRVRTSSNNRQSV